MTDPDITDPAALTDLIARLDERITGRQVLQYRWHDKDDPASFETEVVEHPDEALLAECRDVLEVLVARTTEAEAERSAALQIIGLLVSRAGGEVVITDREVVGSGPFDVGWFKSIDPPARKIVVREHAYGVTTEGEPA